MYGRLTCYLAYSIISLSIVVTAGCGDSGNPVGADSHVPKPPAKGAIGADCSNNDDCDSRYCATDALFPGGYCLANCGEDTACAAGATCSEFFTYQWCLDDCTTDEDCRDGYLCQYQVCRPGCAGEDMYCVGDDHCGEDGRCEGLCKTHADCTPNRCQDGLCVPPCQHDDECLPGFGCDTATGECGPKAGKLMGEACSQPGATTECATGYCLPTRRICSILCQGSSECPSDYACGLEKIDTTVNGKFDDAAAACVPHVGGGVAGATCAADGDCASGHCYNGWCMEGCANDTFCATSHQCVGTKLILDAALVGYKGCLPRQGSAAFTLGTLSTAEYYGFDVPENATSIVLTTESAAKDEITLVSTLTDPDGKTLFEIPEICDYYSQPNRYLYSNQISTMQVPNTSNVTLKPGIYTYTMATSSEPALDVTVKLYTQLGVKARGTLNINWAFVNLANHPCISGTLSAASAPNHSWFTRQRTALVSILQRANLQIGSETFFDVNAPSLSVLDIGADSTETGSLFEYSASRPAGSLTFFFVRSIEDSLGGGGQTLGISGGIPGPPVVGKVNSGIAVSMQTACYEQYGYNPGHTMAHEIGHFLGLFHNVESDFNPGFDQETNEVTCPCPCGDNLVCQSGWGGAQWCRGVDHLPDTDGSSSNLMFWAAESTQDFEGNELSAGQVRVMLDNPLVK
ncbi:MAG: hypothetical protein JRH20_23450 [Deltaproteobacteria bacterium]|nr:hypothetical protein [Deltaproteobacteria bacterium]